MVSKTSVTIVKTTTKSVATISAEEIRKAFDLPRNAIISVQVPGGANIELIIDLDTSLEAYWEETTERRNQS